MRIICCIVVLMLMIGLQAQEAKSPFLWTIEGEKPTYLLGTIHIGVNAKKQLPKVVWEKFASCSTLVIEMNMPNPFEYAMAMQLPHDKSLDQYFSDKEWENIKGILHGQPDILLKRLKPWAISSLVIQQLLPPVQPMELVFMQQAKTQKMTIGSLETWQSQIKALDSVPVETMTKEITKMIASLDDTKKQLTQLTNAYLRGDPQELENVLAEGAMAMSPEAKENLLYKRNRMWIKGIEKYIAKGDVFIAVGAGHLTGDQGLIALLQAKGYRLKKIE